jgi:CheY-like chemotaxis protein
MPAVEAWATPTVTCVLVPHGQQMDVELRNAEGVAFLRKTTPNRQSAKNEAAVLRLFLDEERRGDRAERGLKPFVLIVEDDADSREGLAEVMRAAGVRVLAVGLGRDGLRFAQELTPDLILLDHRLPDLEGIEICRQLRAHPAMSKIPIVIVSASPESIRDGDRSEGPNVVLAKPCGFDTILATARLLLRDVAAVETGGAPLR